MEVTATPVTGSDLVDLRDSKGIRQKDIAKRLGITRGSLNGWEKGRTKLDELMVARYEKAVAELFAEALGR